MNESEYLRAKGQFYTARADVIRARKEEDSINEQSNVNLTTEVQVEYEHKQKQLLQDFEEKSANLKGILEQKIQELKAQHQANIAKLQEEMSVAQDQANKGHNEHLSKQTKTLETVALARQKTRDQEDTEFRLQDERFRNHDNKSLTYSPPKSSSKMNLGQTIPRDIPNSALNSHLPKSNESLSIAISESSPSLPPSPEISAKLGFRYVLSECGKFYTGPKCVRGVPATKVSCEDEYVINEDWETYKSMLRKSMDKIKEASAQVKKAEEEVATVSSNRANDKQLNGLRIIVRDCQSFHKRKANEHEYAQRTIEFFKNTCTIHPNQLLAKRYMGSTGMILFEPLRMLQKMIQKLEAAYDHGYLKRDPITELRILLAAEIEKSGSSSKPFPLKHTLEIIQKDSPLFKRIERLLTSASSKIKNKKSNSPAPPPPPTSSRADSIAARISSPATTPIIPKRSKSIANTGEVSARREITPTRMTPASAKKLATSSTSSVRISTNNDGCSPQSQQQTPPRRVSALTQTPRTPIFRKHVLDNEDKSGYFTKNFKRSIAGCSPTKELPTMARQKRIPTSPPSLGERTAKIGRLERSSTISTPASLMTHPSKSSPSAHHEVIIVRDFLAESQTRSSELPIFKVSRVEHRSNKHAFITTTSSQYSFKLLSGIFQPYKNGKSIAREQLNLIIFPSKVSKLYHARDSAKVVLISPNTFGGESVLNIEFCSSGVCQEFRSQLSRLSGGKVLTLQGKQKLDRLFPDQEVRA